MSSSTVSSPLHAKAPFIVLNASAGSGKTYALVQHVLLNALRPKDMPNAYQKVLAITFTNNAADEMKGRLLEHLLAFSVHERPEQDGFFQPIWKALELSANELQRRAKAASKHMLHNYSTLNVGTIDQFTHRLVRTFTKDLNLDDNFEVRLDLDAMVTEALDLLYSSLGEHPHLRDALVTLVQERMNRDENHNPDHALKREGKNSFNEDTWEHLKKLPLPSRMIEIEQELKEKITAICAQAKALSNEARAIIKQEGYDADSMIRFKDVNNHLVGQWQNLKRHDMNAGAYVWQSRVKQGDGSRWSAFKEKAQEFQGQEKQNLMLLKQATAKLQQLAATRALLDKFDELQKNQNTMPLSAFNKLISEELQREPTAFIYARLGEKFWHFYIDEFQDTSSLQFENIHPLIEHTLTKDESKNTALIVGDPKQSIYRWRGGKAEQFMSLTEGSHLSNRFEQLPNGHQLYKRETIQLGNNFRTHGAIVSFNNDFFPHLSSSLTSAQHRDAYASHSVVQQPKVSDDLGEVRVNLYRQSEGIAPSAEEFGKLVCRKTLERINELRAQGSSYSDIAILVRGNSNGKKLANYLTQQSVPVLSADSLLLSNAHESAVLVSTAKLFLNPSDKIARFELAYALGKLDKLDQGTERFVFEKAVANFGVSALVKYFPKSAALLQGADSLFAFAVRVFDAFDMLHVPNAMVDAALDLIYTFQCSDGTFATLPGWWADESAKRNVPVSQDRPAVRIMTIHKSKGLEFEHVILPFEVNLKSDDSDHWIPFPLHDELPRMPVSKSKKTQELFDSELADHIDNQSYFDWMNMVYVAMTRPVSGLHIFLNGDKLGTFGTQIVDYIGVDTDEWRTGKKAPIQERNNEHAPVPTQGPLAMFSPAHLRMANTAPEKWQEGGTDAKKWGTALHRILQLPQSMRETAIKRLYRSGEFSSNLQDRARQVLTEMSVTPELDGLNSMDTVVYMERSMVSKEITLRPDLIIHTSKKTTVIDYKTGIPNKKNDQQLQEYVDALSNTFKNVTGELLYL